MTTPRAKKKETRIQDMAKATWWLARDCADGDQAHRQCEPQDHIAAALQRERRKERRAILKDVLRVACEPGYCDPPTVKNRTHAFGCSYKRILELGAKK